MSKYKKGDKFIIELGEQVGDLWRSKGFNALVFDDFGLDRLGQLVQGVDQYSRMKGQQEAWELAQRIEKEPCDGGFTLNDIHDIFGYLSTNFAIKAHSYAEAAAKVEAWEQKKEKEIRVGDVVKLICNGRCGVVTKFTDNFYYVFTSDSTPFQWLKNDCTKTGRHIDIEAVLDQIGE